MTKQKRTQLTQSIAKMTVARFPDESPERAIARTVLLPTTQAAGTMFYLTQWGRVLEGATLSLEELIRELRALSATVNDKNLGRGTAMLTAQAHTLDSIYNALVRKAIDQDRLDLMEAYFKLALRAQSQCRSTWGAISAIQNPPMAGYVGQANIVHGPQQVNNASAVVNSASRAGETSNPKSKLLEAKDGERLDLRAAGASGGADPAMATLGTVDGAKVG